MANVKGLELHFRVKTEVVSHYERPIKRLLLYKHGDDLRQELLAIQFIERCNGILLSSGLDLKLKTFSCQPVGSKTVSVLRVLSYNFVLAMTNTCYLVFRTLLRASLSGFEEQYLYQNFAIRLVPPIQDPMLARVRARESRKLQPTKLELSASPLRLMRF